MKILIVEVNWLGDVLFSTPAIRAVRRKFPDSHIAALIVPRVKEVLTGNPNIDEFIINDEDGLHKGLKGKFRLISEIKEKGFDLAIFFHRSFSRALIIYFSHIAQRAGYSTWKRWFLLAQRVKPPPKDSLHRVDYYLNIVKALGCPVEERQYEFFTSNEDDIFAQGFLKGAGVKDEDLIICMNPGGNWLLKRWPKENFALLADKMIDKYKAKVIFSGSEKDTELAKDISFLMKNRPIIACGSMSLKQSACLFRRAKIFICADTGPLHIAASVGANIIALFGPTSPKITGPIGKGKIRIIQKCDCIIPCYDKKCLTNTCMQKIMVEDVLGETDKLLNVHNVERIDN